VCATYFGRGSGACTSSPWGLRHGMRTDANRGRLIQLLIEGLGNSFMVVVDAFGDTFSSSTKIGSRKRRDWVRGDVRCLMCGRLLGRLLGTTRARENGDRTAGSPTAFLAYRPLDPVDRIVPFWPGLRFRCRVCGGAGALDDVDVLSTYDDLPTVSEDG